MGKYREQLHELLVPLLAKTGYSLQRLEERYVKGELQIKIVVDRPQPISLNDIVRLSEKIGDKLDAIDFIDESYLLDISSLGAEKKIPVSEIKHYRHRYVHLTFKEAIEKHTSLTGTIIEVDETSLTLEHFQKGQKKQTRIRLDLIASSRCAVKI
ncbi:MAG: ribosome maturation factor RimP [Bacilli bacterium]